MLVSVRLFGLTESSARSHLCFESPYFMSLTVSSYESKFYLHIIIELGYLFEIISYSLTLYEHYCVYLQWLVIRFLKATKHKKKSS